MSRNSVEKLQEAEELRINFGINIDKRDDADARNDTEVVYKPTTMNNDWNQNFQSLKPENQVTPKDSLFLYGISFAGNFLAFATGIGLSWTSPVLPKLHGPNSPLDSPIDASEESVIAGILGIGAAVGPFLFGYLADKIGRKKTLILIAMPMVIGLSMLAFTDKVKLYYLGRLLYGVGVGGVFTVLTMYIGEVTTVHNRGKFSCIFSAFVALGILYPLSIGGFLSIRTFCLSCLIPLQLFLIFFTIYAPDSPAYLVKTTKFAEAETALVNLHSLSREQAQKEVSELKKTEDHQQHEKGGIVVLFKVRSTRRAFMVAAGLLILQQFAGISIVLGFMESIFQSTGSSIPPQIATTFIGTVQILTVIVTSSVIEKLGRKFLLLISLTGSAVSVILLGFYFFLQRHQFSTLAYFWWLPITCLLLYIICFNLGLGPIPWTILSEIFPDNVKSIGASLVSATCFGVAFVVTMAYPILSEMLGMAESFWLFGICCVIGVIFVHYVVPETKGKNITEIQEMLNK